MQVDNVDLIPLDESRIAIIAKPNGSLVFIDYVDELIPKKSPTGEILQPDVKEVYETSDMGKLEFENWAEQNSHLFKATPKYRGVIYNKNEGKIESYIMFPGDDPPYGEVTETVPILKPNAENHDLKNSLPPSFFENSIQAINLESSIGIPRFDWDYNDFAYNHPRDKLTAGEVLVPPRVIHAVRVLEKERLLSGYGAKSSRPQLGTSLG